MTVVNNHTDGQDMVNMTEKEFDKFRNLVYAGTHIFCVDSQKPLFERKIRLRATALHLSSFQEYYHLITESTEGEQEFTRLIDVLAVHETSFFRIPGHFTGLETVVFPEFFQRPSEKEESDIRIWSAGCSSGEEPYSIAISFLKVLASRELSISETRGMRILATDVSPSVIETAREGIYSLNHVQKIRKPLLDKYFEYHNHQYYVIQQVKNFVDFHVFNLINIETPPAPEFDAIFCRNLLIYFDRAAQERLLMGLVNLLPEGGYLFLGDAESMHMFSEAVRKFDFIESGNAIFYKKRGVHTQ
jgi:chemotaxis protein methyltransferase CheR